MRIRLRIHHYVGKRPIKRVKQGVIIKYIALFFMVQKGSFFLDFRLDLFNFPRDIDLIRHNNMPQTYRQNLQKLQEVIYKPTFQNQSLHF